MPAGWTSLLPPVFFIALLCTLIFPRSSEESSHHATGGGVVRSLPASSWHYKSSSLGPLLPTKFLPLPANSPAAAFSSKVSEEEHVSLPKSPPLAPSLAPPPPACDVLCWLNSLKIPIPAVSIEHLGMTITIFDGTCSGAQFSDLKSAVAPPRSAEFDILGVSLACNLQWKLSSLLFNSQGAVEAAVSDSKLQFGFTIATDHDDLVQSVTPTGCAPDIHISELHFSGDLAGLLNFMTKLLESTIVNAVNTNLCTGIDTGLVILSGALRNISDTIRPFTRPLPPPAPPPIPNGSVDFTQNQYAAPLFRS